MLRPGRALVWIFDQSERTGFSEMSSPPQRQETTLLQNPLDLEIPVLPIFSVAYNKTTLLLYSFHANYCGTHKSN